MRITSFERRANSAERMRSPIGNGARPSLLPQLHDAVMFVLGALAMLAFLTAR